MAKKGNKKRAARKSGKRARGPRRPKTRGSMAMIPKSMPGMRAVCALTDPFCNASVGARWPDWSASPTVPLRVDSLYTITTNASGTAAMTFMPIFPYGIMTSTVAGSTATCAATYTDFDPNLTTFLQNNAACYRVVNFGLEIIPIVATMTNQGFFITAETIVNRGPGSTFVTPSTLYPNVMVSNIVGDKVGFISRPQGPDSYNMKPLNVNNQFQDTTWSGVTVMVMGAQASTPTLMVRVRANIEYEASNANLYGVTAKPATSNNFLTDVVSRVREKMDPIIKGGAEVAERSVMKWAGEMLSRGLGTIAGYYLGGPEGGAVGGAIAGGAAHMIMDVD